MTEDQITAAREASAAAAACEPAPALAELSARLGLAAFEQEILLLCAAMELDRRPAPCARWLSATSAGHGRPRASSRALRRPELGGPFAAEPAAALASRRDYPAARPTAAASALRADERIVSYVKGLNYLDDRFEPLLAAVPRPEGDLPVSQQATVRDILQGWARSSALSSAPVVQLLGPDHATKLSVAADAAGRRGRRLYRLPVGSLPLPSADLEMMARLWSRRACCCRSSYTSTTMSARRR